MDREDDPREKKQEAPDRFIKADDFGLRAEMQDDFGDENDNSFTIATRYEAISTLGEGGMGTVYKAHDNRLEHSVAVKTILP